MIFPVVLQLRDLPIFQICLTSKPFYRMCSCQKALIWVCDIWSFYKCSFFWIVMALWLLNLPILNQINVSLLNCNVLSAADLDLDEPDSVAPRLQSSFKLIHEVCAFDFWLTSPVNSTKILKFSSHDTKA